MDTRFVFLIAAACLLVQVTGEEAAAAAAGKEASEDLKTAESSRCFGGYRPSQSGYYGNGYQYPNPNYNQYYPNTGYGHSYPNYNYPNNGGYPGGYVGYPGGYSTGFGNGYSSGFGYNFNSGYRGNQYGYPQYNGRGYYYRK